MKIVIAFILLFGIVYTQAQQPKMMLPIGHSRSVNAIDISKDGKKIITVSWDNTAKIWETATGKLLKDIKGYVNEYVKFSSDGKYIITSSDRGADGYFTQVWDAVSGSLLHTKLCGRSESLSFLPGFSPDSKKFTTVNYDQVQIWDVISGRLVDSLVQEKEFASAEYSPDGRYILTRGDEDTIARLWDAGSGKLIDSFQNDALDIRAAHFSKDGKSIIISSGYSVRIWNIASKKLMQSFIGHLGMIWETEFNNTGTLVATASHDTTARIWDASSGKVLKILKGHKKPLTGVKFSPDGKYIATTSWDYAVKVWETATGKLLFSLDDLYLCYNTKSITFSNDGENLLAGRYPDNTVKAWNIQKRTLTFVFKGQAQQLNYSRLSPNGNSFMFSPSKGKTRVFDVNTGRLLYQLNGSTPQYSADGRLIATIAGAENENVFISDAESGRQLWELKGGKQLSYAEFNHDGQRMVTYDYTNSILWDITTGQPVDTIKSWKPKFSPDGKTVVTVRQNMVYVWDAYSGKLIKEWQAYESDPIGSFQFNKGGNLLFTINHIYDGIPDSIKLWDAATGKLIHSFNATTAEFSPDGKIAATGYGGRVQLWNLESGQLIATLVVNTYWLLPKIIFSPSGKFILTTSRYGVAKLWDAASGNLLHTFQGHTNDIEITAFIDDEKSIVTAADDHTVRMWNTATGRQEKQYDLGANNYVKNIDLTNDRFMVWNSNEIKIMKFSTGEILYTFFAVESTDYLVTDKYSRFDGTELARKLLYFVCNDEIIELDQLKDQLWVPNLVERIMNGDSINAKALGEVNICGLTPLVEDKSNKAGAYYFEIKPRRGGLGETVVYVNGIEARRYKTGQLKKQGDVYELILSKTELNNYLIAGKENPVTVKAYTADNSISSRGIIINEDKTQEKTTAAPNLYAVMVGVSDYKDEELDLKYAAKDANDVSAAVAASARKLLNSDGKEHVFVYDLTTSEKRYQLPEKNSIKKVLEEIGKKATSNDILLLFFAGHGVMSARAGEQQQFYFLTADASKTTATSAVTDVGISTTELTEWMKPQNIKAQKRILIFDACNSGQAIRDLVKVGNEGQGYMAARSDEQSQQIKAIDKLNEQSGFFILSASASNQSAYEMGRYSQGLLTYSLLKAIKQQPDILADGKYLDVSRWFNAAEKTVTELTKESGARQQPQVISNTNFTIGIVDEEVMAKIVLPQEKPLFTNSNLQNADENIAMDDLELNKWLDARLSDIAARGSAGNIVYSAGIKSADAWALGGRYEVNGNTITARINIRQGREIKYRFEFSGTKDKLQELVTAIATKATEVVK